MNACAYVIGYSTTKHETSKILHLEFSTCHSINKNDQQYWSLTIVSVPHLLAAKPFERVPRHMIYFRPKLPGLSSVQTP
uniref:Uncharacterized protein n=1 Tax=Setaria italica TaxID=4555 RepID=K4AHI0_SETIT